MNRIKPNARSENASTLRPPRIRKQSQRAAPEDPAERLLLPARIRLRGRGETPRPRVKLSAGKAPYHQEGVKARVKTKDVVRL